MMNNFTRTEKIIILSACFVVLCLLLMRTCNPIYNIKQKPITITTHDTTRIESGPDTIRIHDEVPVIRHIFVYQQPDTAFGQFHDTGYNAYSQGYKDASQALSKMRYTCRDTTYYNDTIQQGSWKLYLQEWVTRNSIIKRIPIVTSQITYIKDSSVTTLPPKPEKIKFYAGVDLLINTTVAGRWDIGPSGLITIPKGWAFNYTYGIHNNTHEVGVKALIRFTKQKQ